MELTLNHKQGLVLTTPAQEILYGGAVGGGKSHLLRVLAVTFAVSVPGIQVFLARRMYKELILNHMNASNSLPAMLKPMIANRLVSYNKQDGQYNFVNGSNIVLCHSQAEMDIDKYQGSEIQVLLVDEATHFTEYMLRFLRSRVRLGTMRIPEQYRDKLPLIVYGSNPGGVGHYYMKTQFVDHGDMVIHKAPPEEGGMMRQFISAKLSDNTAMMKIDPHYADRVRGIGGEGLVAAMLDGDWNTSDTLAFPNLHSDIHILDVDGRDLPDGFKFFRCFDYGYSAPSVSLWLAVSNGESMRMADGSWKDTPRGSVIVINEDHQRKKVGVGLKLTSAKSSMRIKRIDDIYGGRIRPGPADSSIFNMDRGTKSLADEYEENGVRWLRANKAPGTRVQGLQLLNDMITESGKAFPERPCLYLTPKTTMLMGDMKNLELDPKTLDDVDTNSPYDHSYDALRYGILHLQKEVRTMPISGY